MVKDPPTTAGVKKEGSIPGSGRYPGGGNGSPLQYSCLGNPMNRGACWATIHGIAKARYNLVTKPPPSVIAEELLQKNRK